MQSFFDENKPKIEEVVSGIALNLSNGFTEMKSIVDKVFETVNKALTTNKPIIESAVSKICNNLFSFAAVTGLIVSDMFRIVTSSINDWLTTSKPQIDKAMNGIVSVITSSVILIATITSDILDSIKWFWDTWGKDIYKGVVGIFIDIATWILEFYNTSLIPIFNTALGWIYKIWSDNLKGIVEELLGFAGRVGEIALLVYQQFIKPMIDSFMKDWLPVITESIKLAIGIFGSLVNGVAGVVRSVLEVINGLIDIIIGVFTDDWGKAWSGVVGVFKGIFDTCYEIGKSVINSIIETINSLIRSINKVSPVAIKEVALIGAKAEAPSYMPTDVKSTPIARSDMFSKLNNFMNNLKLDTYNPDLTKLNGLSDVADKFGESLGKGIPKKFTDKDYFKNLASIPQFADNNAITSPTLSTLSYSTPTLSKGIDEQSLSDKISSAVTNAMLQVSRLESTGTPTQGPNQDISIKLDGTILGRLLIPYLKQQEGRIGNYAIIQSY